MRPRLSPEEREARRRERARFSFSDQAYRHYDPDKEGYGNASQWEEIARKMFGLNRIDHQTKPNKWLTALYLTEMPGTLEQLKKAFRAAMFRNHPDYGGTNEQARATMEAFETLRHRFS